VIFDQSRDIGLGCLQSCNHYKDDGRGYVPYHGKKDTPSVLMNLVKVAVCGTGS
jgi:hypothetical protein